MIYQGDTILLAPFYSTPYDAPFDSLDHFYSWPAAKDMALSEDLYNYAHYCRRWKILSARASALSPGSTGGHYSSFAHRMKLYFDAAENRYHICYYCAKTKEVVYDGGLNHLYTLSVFDNSISYKAGLALPEEYKTNHITGGIGLRYNGYYENRPVTIIATNYRLSFTSSFETKRRMQANDLEKSYTEPIELRYNCITNLPTPG